MKCFAFVLCVMALNGFADVHKATVHLKSHLYDLKQDPKTPSVIVGFDFDDVLMPTSLLHLSEIPQPIREKYQLPQSNLLDLAFKSRFSYTSIHALSMELPWHLPLKLEDYLQVKRSFDETGFVLFKRGTQIGKLISQLSMAASLALLDAAELSTDKTFILSNGTPEWIEGAVKILGEPFLGIYSRMKKSGKLEVHSSYSFTSRPPLVEFEKRWSLITRLYYFNQKNWQFLCEKSKFKAHAMSHVLSGLNDQLLAKGYRNPWNLVYVGDLPHDMLATYAQGHASLGRSAGIKLFGDMDLGAVYSDPNKRGLTSEELNYFWYQKIQELTKLRRVLATAVSDLKKPNRQDSKFLIYRISHMKSEQNRIHVLDRPMNFSHPEELVMGW